MSFHQMQPECQIICSLIRRLHREDNKVNSEILPYLWGKTPCMDVCFAKSEVKSRHQFVWFLFGSHTCSVIQCWLHQCPSLWCNVLVFIINVTFVCHMEIFHQFSHSLATLAPCNQFLQSRASKALLLGQRHSNLHVCFTQLNPLNWSAVTRKLWRHTIKVYCLNSASFQKLYIYCMACVWSACLCIHPFSPFSFRKQGEQISQWSGRISTFLEEKSRFQ